MIFYTAPESWAWHLTCTRITWKQMRSCTTLENLSSPLPALQERPLHPSMLPTETQSVSKQPGVLFTGPNGLMCPDWMKREHHFTYTEATSARNT